MALVGPNLILTLTGQKLIQWSVTLYMSLLLRVFCVFNVFKNPKNVTFTFFCFVAYVFSNSGPDPNRSTYACKKGVVT